jgi:16S rRNA (guanine966-N2)-methyltransferase
MSAVQFELPDSRVVDLFAGSGALGLEALSRGAAHATFVETWPGAIAQLKANIETLGAADQTDIVREDALEYAARIETGAYDLAFADPPYGQGLAAGLLEQFAQRAFASTLWVEHRSDEPLPRLPGARTRRYGDTSITSIPAEP